MRKNKMILVILILSVIALIFSGCGVTSQYPDDEPLETIIPETTMALEEETTAQIVSVAEDHSIITSIALLLK